MSNWPVETTSARTLTTELFRRPQRRPDLSGAQALQQAMTWLIDEAVAVDPGSRRAGTRACLTLTVLVGLLAAGCQGAMSVEEARQVTASFTGGTFVPPPRTINDITAILNQPRVEPESGARRQADAAPPPAADPDTLAQFYLRRGLAARVIGRAGQETADLTLALGYAREGLAPASMILHHLAIAEVNAGKFSRAADYLHRSNEAIGSIDRSWLIHNNAVLATIYGSVGDAKAAEAALAEASRVFDDSLGWSYQKPEWLSMRRSQIAAARGALLEASGDAAAAEPFYREALAALAGDPFYARDPSLDVRHYYVARNLARQGRLVEAEAEARTAVLGALAKRGRYSPHTAFMLRALVGVLLQQARYRDAETLARATVDIYEKVGASPDSLPFALAREQLARALAAQHRDREAVAEYAALRAGLAADPGSLEARYGGTTGYAAALLRTGHADRAVKLLEAERRRARAVNYGETTAVVRAYLAQAYAAQGNIDRALAEFHQAMPDLLAGAADVDEGATSPRAADERLVDLLGSYIGMLADIAGTPRERETGIDAVAEAFRLADVARGRSLQRALDASAARAAARTPALADLVRREQDARRQLTAIHRGIANLLGQPGDQQDSKILADLRARAETLRRARLALATRIAQDFPEYAELTHPKPVTVEQARAVLRPGEALIATLVTLDRTFVWAVPHRGPVAFAASPLGAARMEQMIGALRQALEPRARTLGDIAAFDVSLAYRLYSAVLEPVRSGWQDAQSLLVVAHGPLGRLPVAALPTARVSLPAESGALFSSYRAVPWLVRTHAVTMLPSVASLTTLRTLPPGDPGRRPFAGFGDPYFSKEQAAAATRESSPPERVALVTRAVPITLRSSPPALDSVRLASLPRLPETAAEIQGLASAMNADGARDIFLGARANEQAVKTLDLAAYRVIAFATHGLMPGDLDGLTQPALALSAPEVAGVAGDGLLTQDEILGLRLDADWIVLSACNTAGGQGAGAEALSGLGRAFFYAGARALLVSHWPVETTSAYALTTNLFRRQRGSATVSRARALQETMNWLIDRGERVDSGTVVFSYAHPIFWAPFALIGDGSTAAR